MVDEVLPHRLLEYLGEAAEWWKVDGRIKTRPSSKGAGDAQVRTAPTLEIARHFLARGQ